jgi:hypothetical protein
LGYEPRPIDSAKSFGLTTAISNFKMREVMPVYGSVTAQLTRNTAAVHHEMEQVM